MKKKFLIILSVVLISTSVITKLSISTATQSSISVSSLIKLAYGQTETPETYYYVKYEIAEPVEELISSEMICCWQHCNTYIHWTCYRDECYGTGSINCAEYENCVYEYDEVVCWDI